MTDIVVASTTNNVTVLQSLPATVVTVQAAGPQGIPGSVSGIAAITGGTIDGAVIGGTTAAGASVTSLTFPGTGGRIVGLSSNTPHANRLLFQNSTTNGQSSIGVIPNGSGTGSFLRAYNSSDPDNSAVGQLVTNSLAVSLNCITTGTGTLLPLSFQIDSVEGMRLDTNLNVGIGGLPTAGYRLEVTKSVDGPHAVIIRNTNAGASATSILQLTNDTKFVNSTVNFSGNFYAVSSGGGINAIYNSFDSHIWRNSAGTEYGRADSAGRLIWGYSAHVGLQASTYLGQFLATGTNFPLAAGYTANTIVGPKFTLAKNRAATWATQTIVQSGDTLGEIDFMGSDGTNIIPAARIGAYVDGTPGANDMPGRLSIWTTADGASSPAERIRVDSAGNVGIGVFANLSTLTVNGSVAAKSPSTINAASYSVVATDFSLRFTTTNCTLTLPAAASFPGRILQLNTITANSVTSASSNVIPLGSNTAGTAILAATAGKFTQLQSDGTNWITMMSN